MGGELISVVLATAVLFPLLSSLVLGLGLRKGSVHLVGTIGSLAVWVSFACILGVFWATARDTVSVVSWFVWLSSAQFQVPFAFQVDALSLLMGLIVTGIGGLIHVYAIGYMREDETPSRFFSYLNLFVVAMLILVFAANLPLMFIGWEGVGLCSYLLIGYWHEREANGYAGLKAFVVNRVGDLGFLLGIFGILALFGTVSFLEILEVIERGFMSPETSWGLLNVTALCLFVGAVGKSAQIPLYVWLPDAMAGPTPVSALIHAATMVTAGLVMVTRMWMVFSVAPLASEVVLWVGSLTAVFAAVIGVCQRDIKKVLAYSTVSQLGYMFAAMGVGAYVVGMFHVFTHAFFKALLFLGAGSVIVAAHHEQDMFRLGGLRSRMPLTFWTMMVGTLALAGIFPFSGFFSKDEILFTVYEASHGVSLPYLLLLLGAFLTAFYMMRLIGLTFFGSSRAQTHEGHPPPAQIQESPGIMTVPLIVLAIGSTGVGLLGMPVFMSPVNGFQHFFELGGFPVSDEHHGPALLLAMGSLSVAGLGLFLGYYFYIRRPNIPGTLQRKFSKLHTWVLNKFYVDELYHTVIVRPLVWASRQSLRYVDQFLIDGMVNGIGLVSRKTGQWLGSLQTGNVQTYAVILLMGGLFLIIFFLQRFFLI